MSRAINRKGATVTFTEWDGTVSDGTTHTGIVRDAGSMMGDRVLLVRDNDGALRTVLDSDATTKA